MICRTIGHLGNKYKAYRASQAADVNIHSGEATSFKASIKDRVKSTWTDVKTKVGDVKVQAGEAFDNFKNRVSNVKNKTVAAGAEALSNKVRNFNDAMETGRQNVQNMMDSIGNQPRPAFALAGDGNVNLPKSNVSTRIDDFADRIQQISVDHKQKIAAFEGRGGQAGEHAIPEFLDGKFTDPDVQARYERYLERKAKQGAVPREPMDWKKVSDHMANVRNQGRQYELERLEDFKKIATDVEEQITIEVVDSNGEIVRTRVDAIGYDKKTGELLIQEYKSSATAPLTKNQLEAFRLISKGSNGTVVGKGKGIFKGGFEIPPGTNIEVIRPE